ncbi:MAG: head GIN domain-containing protein [Fulvivirga sp.]|nr:head GIN domain-containing protein [Fulvivirga sp.]
MKKYFLPILLLVFYMSGCDLMVAERGNGNMETREVAIEDFEELEVKGNFQINLMKGEMPGIKITADENLHEFIEVANEGDRLEVETTATIKSKKGLTLDITYTDLRAIDVGGAATIENAGVIRGDYLSISMAGAGSVRLEVDLKVLNITLSGAGAVELKGKADEQNIQMSGAGGLDAFDLISKKCDVDISGVGSANIYVEEELSAEVSGVGGITYKGSPNIVNQNISGLGSIEKADGSAEDENI